MSLYAERFKNRLSAFKIDSIEFEGEVYYLREMSVGQKIKLMQEYGLSAGNKETSTSDLMAYSSKMVLMSLCTREGVLTEDPNDLSVLENIPSTLMEQLVKVVMELNGLSDKAQDDLKKE